LEPFPFYLPQCSRGFGRFTRPYSGACSHTWRSLGGHYIKSYFGDARGTYINRNHFAGFLEMIFPLILGYTLSLSNWQEKLSLKVLMSTDRLNFQFFLTIGLSVMLLALVFSKSRGFLKVTG
jgi:hypothetical protein